MSSGSSGNDVSSAAGSVSEPEPEPEPEPAPPPEPIVSHLMVAGDVMSHMPITKDAYVKETGEYDYSHMFADAAQQVETADYAIASTPATPPSASRSRFWTR